MESCKEVLAPASPSASIPPQAVEGVVDKERYARFPRAVGPPSGNCVCVCVRPDIAFTVKTLASSMNGRAKEGFTRLRQICRYIEGALYDKMPLRPYATLPATSCHDAELRVLVDANWAGCPSTGKHTSD